MGIPLEEDAAGGAVAVAIEIESEGRRAEAEILGSRLGAAATTNRVVAALGRGSGVSRTRSGVTPRFSAASARRRVALKVSFAAGPAHSSSTVPSAGQARPASAAQSASSGRPARTSRTASGAIPKAARPGA